jgi:hypothetical protein
VKKLLSILIAFFLPFALPAFAEHGAADVVMEGETYHLVLDSVEVVDGKLTVIIRGFGSTLRMGATGMMLAGLPEAHYGDEVVPFSSVNATVGGPFAFVFERDSLPDSIWVNSYDEGIVPVPIWRANGAVSDSAEAYVRADAEGVAPSSAEIGRAEYKYARACAYAEQGLYYQAKLAFMDSGWDDWEERAAACVQPWPEIGALYENPDVTGSDTELTLVFKGDSNNTAMLAKVYTAEGALARTVFLLDAEEVAIPLPAGAYVIRYGIGSDWYGEADTFGGEGVYRTLTFADDAQEVRFESGYQYKITVDMNAQNAEAPRGNWRDF